MTPEILLGPPGTGKTTSLLDILDEELTRGTRPDRIGFVSFTKKAAEEAASRAVKRFSVPREELPYFRTLHSLCYRMLGVRSGDVMEYRQIQEFAKWIGIKFTGRLSEDGTTTGFEIGDRIMFMENLARIRGIDLRIQYDLDDDDLPWTEVERVAEGLRIWKAHYGLIDYTDMLSRFVDSRLNVKLDVLLVDEWQDLSWMQILVVNKLAKGARRVVYAGDDDQAIYRWAGADVDHMIKAEGDVRVLGQSYRCPPVIAELALGVISHVKNRRPKVWQPRQGERGELLRANSFSDVDAGAGEVLVLARNTYVLQEQVEPMLKRQGIVYEMHGHQSIRQSMLNAIITWEDLRKGKRVRLGDARVVYEYMSTGTGVKRGFKKLEIFGEDPELTVDMRELKTTGGLLRDDIWHEALERMPTDEMSYVLAALRRGEKVRAAPRVRLSTIHGAKGGQADHVVLMTEMARRTFREMEQNPEDEARVWYVGVTRAKQKLTIVNSETRQFCPWV